MKATHAAWRIAVVLLPLVLFACAPKTPAPAVDPYALPGESVARPPGLLHEVSAGESWRTLAENYYGDADRAGRLRRVNRRLKGSLEPGLTVFVPLDADERRAFEDRARARAPYNKGLELARAGDFPAAILQFREALSLDPRLARAHYNLGLVYRRSGRPALALESLARACELERKSPDYLYALGSILAELGRPREAEKRYGRALNVEPFHLPSLYALARSLDARGKHRQAETHWRRIQALAPESVRGQEAARRLGMSP